MAPALSSMLQAAERHTACCLSVTMSVLLLNMQASCPTQLAQAYQLDYGW